MRIINEHVRLSVPATSANLGPGFDSLGLAVNLCDEVEAWATAGTFDIHVEGHGANTVPTDETHLIARTVNHVLDLVGAPAVGLRMRCKNRIPHGRGLGSSAAAIVAGMMIARAFVDHPEALDEKALIDIGGALEGHADNIAPAVLGGVTIAWSQQDTMLAPAHYQAVKLPTTVLHHVSACVPTQELLTTKARAVLPATVSHEDAAANSARVGLLTYALQNDAKLLLEGTKDYLHQSYRFGAMPDSLRLVDHLRANGWPAVISGAGPTVMVLDKLDYNTTVDLQEQGWDVKALSIFNEGAKITS